MQKHEEWIRSELEKTIANRTKMNATIRKEQKKEGNQEQESERKKAISIVTEAIKILNSYPKQLIQVFEVGYWCHSGTIFFLVRGVQRYLTIEKIKELEKEINKVGNRLEIAYEICRFLRKNFPNQTQGILPYDKKNVISDFFCHINF